MAVDTPPIFLQASAHSAEFVRRYLSGLRDDQEGLLYSGDLAVTQNGTPNMSVNVAAGRCYVLNDYSSFGGLYAAEARSTTNLAIAASDPTNPRRDLVVAEVLDAAYSGASNLFQLRVVTGTPAASPVDPATPNSALVLARVAVAAGATTVVNANITAIATRWDNWRKPQQVLASANPTSTSTTMVDIAGTTITVVTPRPNVTVVLMGVADIDTDNASTIGTVALNVDGSDQANVIVHEAVERKTLSQIWVVNLASSGSHTLKLRFNRASGTGTVSITQTHTNLALINAW